MLSTSEENVDLILYMILSVDKTLEPYLVKSGSTFAPC